MNGNLFPLEIGGLFSFSAYLPANDSATISLSPDSEL